MPGCSNIHWITMPGAGANGRRARYARANSPTPSTHHLRTPKLYGLSPPDPLPSPHLHANMKHLGRFTNPTLQSSPPSGSATQLRFHTDRSVRRSANYNTNTESIRRNDKAVLKYSIYCYNS